MCRNKIIKGNSFRLAIIGKSEIQLALKKTNNVMMRLRLAYIIALCFNLCLSQQKIKILDFKTNNPIPFVTVILDNNTGIYADESGDIELAFLKSDTIHLSCLGYENKEIVVKEIRDEKVYLLPTTTILNEVVVTNRKPNFKKVKVKESKHNNFMEGHMLIIGGELSCLIDNPNNEKNAQLNSVTIPVITKTISFSKEDAGEKQLVNKIKFASKFKMTFYENDGGKPGTPIYTQSNIVFILSQENDAFKIDLSVYNIDLPSKGMFIGFVNLGPVDENDRLIQTEPFEIKEFKGKQIKVAKPTKPYFPVINKEYKPKTFYRFSFETTETTNEWEVFYKHGKKVDAEVHTIGIGYELGIYD